MGAWVFRFQVLGLGLGLGVLVHHGATAPTLEHAWSAQSPEAALCLPPQVEHALLEEEGSEQRGGSELNKCTVEVEERLGDRGEAPWCISQR